MLADLRTATLLAVAPSLPVLADADASAGLTVTPLNAVLALLVAASRVAAHNLTGDTTAF